MLAVVLCQSGIIRVALFTLLDVVLDGSGSVLCRHVSHDPGSVPVKDESAHLASVTDDIGAQFAAHLLEVGLAVVEKRVIVVG